MRSSDARVVRIGDGGRPSDHLPHAVAVAVVAVMVVLGGLAVRLAAAPGAVPDERVPTEVARMQVRMRALDAAKFVWGDATGGASVAGDPGTHYRASLGWRLLLRDPLVGQQSPSPQAAAADSVRVAREAALRLTWWEWAALGVGAFAVAGALIERRVRSGSIVLDGNGLRAGRLDLRWDDLAATWWETDRVRLLTLAGDTVVVEGLAIRPDHLAELQALADERVARRAASMAAQATATRAG